jgi:hypothetical protein
MIRKWKSFFFLKTMLSLHLQAIAREKQRLIRSNKKQYEPETTGLTRIIKQEGAGILPALSAESLPGSSFRLARWT